MSHDSSNARQSSSGGAFSWLNIFPSRAAISQGYETDTPTGEPPRSALLTQICENSPLASFVNTKGFALFVVLFCLRYRPFYRVTKSLLLVSALTCAFVANFNIDLSAEARKKGITIGISRLLLAIACTTIWRKMKPTHALFYCAFVTRFLPPTMFYTFKGLYMVLKRIVSHFDPVDTLSPHHRPDIDLTRQCCICLECECDHLTTCGHSFHRKCIEEWLEVKSRCPLCQGHLNALQSTRRLQQYFVLDREAWNDAHTQAVSGTWWTEQLISFSSSSATAEVSPPSSPATPTSTSTRSTLILPSSSRAGRSRGALNSNLVSQNP